MRDVWTEVYVLNYFCKGNCYWYSNNIIFSRCRHLQREFRISTFFQL